MLGKNICFLSGQIAAPLKFGKAQNGNEYVSFVLEVQTKENADVTEFQSNNKVSVMCFKSSVIKYIREVNVNYTSHVVLIGFVSAYKKEIKGKLMVINTITATDLYAIKTSKDKKDEQRLPPTDDKATCE